MNQIKFRKGCLTDDEQKIITAGFDRHSDALGVPRYLKEPVNWLVYSSQENIVGALTAYTLWDWVYIDELWIDERLRGQGFGKKLLEALEDYARAEKLSGLWLWTQSWQAAGFYEHHGFLEFTRFPDFPKGHFKIGFRKIIKN